MVERERGSEQCRSRAANNCVDVMAIGTQERTVTMILLRPLTCPEHGNRIAPCAFGWRPAGVIDALSKHEEYIDLHLKHQRQDCGTVDTLHQLQLLVVTNCWL